VVRINCQDCVVQLACRSQVLIDSFHMPIETEECSLVATLIPVLNGAS
jgi:hypothetical protein